MSKAKVFIDPKLMEPHYNVRIFSAYLKYLDKSIGPENTDTILRQIGITREYLDNEVNWVSEHFAESFYDHLSKSDQIEPDASYKAGAYAVSREGGGLPVLLASLFSSTGHICNEFVSFSRKYNQVDKVEVLSKSPTHFSLAFHSRRQTQHMKFILDNWKGCLEGIPAITGDTLLQVEHAFASPTQITFTINWKVSNKRRQLGLTILSCLSFGSWIIFRSVTRHSSLPEDVMPFLAFILSCFGLTYQLTKSVRQNSNSAIQQIQNALLSSRERFQDLYENKLKLDRRYREANLLNRIIARITAAADKTNLIETTLEELKTTLGYDRVMFMMHDSQKNNLHVFKCLGFDERIEALLLQYRIELSHETSQEIHLGNVFKSGTKVLAPITSDYIKTLSPEGRRLLEAVGSKSFAMVTVHAHEKKFGVLFADYSSTEKQLTTDDLHIIQNVSNQLAITLHSIERLESESSLRKNFQQYVPPQVVAALTDKSADPYSLGTSKKVTVLMTDIRSFTTIAHNVPTRELLEALDYFHQELSSIVYANGGIVDKYLGDGMLCLFGAFDDSERHFANAGSAIQQITSTVPKINDWMLGRYAWAKRYPFRIAAALHSGEVILANVGGAQKKEFTALGETVNISSRAVSIAKEIQHPGSFSSVVCTSPSLAPKLLMKDIGRFAIRGLPGDTQLYGYSDPNEVSSSTEAA